MSQVGHFVFHVFEAEFADEDHRHSSHIVGIRTGEPGGQLEFAENDTPDAIVLVGAEGQMMGHLPLLKTRERG